MEDYNSDLEQPSTEPQGKAAETGNNLFTIPPLAERDPESLEDDSISGWMLYMYVCIGLGALLSLLSLKEPGVTPIIRYGVWINLAFAVYTIVAAYKRMRNAIFLAKTYIWVSLLTNVCLILQGALVMPVGAGLKTFTAVGAVISAALLFYLYKSHAVEARFPRNMRRAFVWDWLAILVVFVVPFVTIAGSEPDEKELDARMVDVMARRENELCPYDVNAQYTVLSTKTEGNMYVIEGRLDPSLAPETKDVWDALNSVYAQRETKREISEGFLSDQMFVQVANYLKTAEYGIRMIYTSENGKYTATMEISPEEFKELYESIHREK